MNSRLARWLALPALLCAFPGVVSGAFAEDLVPGNEAIKAAVMKSLPLLETGARGSMEKRKQCFTCHTTDKGGANKVGPNLWDIVGRKKAAHPGFGYSSALSAKGGDWSYEDIDHMIFKPTTYVRGTKMAFAGLPKEQERADVIAYLRTMAETPKPLP